MHIFFFDPHQQTALSRQKNDRRSHNPSSILIVFKHKRKHADFHAKHTKENHKEKYSHEYPIQ